MATWNTHVGIALRNGGLGWLNARWTDVDLWSLQEVPSLSTLRRNVDTEAWHVLPDYHGLKPGKYPYVLARRDRFEVMWAHSVDTTNGSRYRRARTTVCLLDRVTGRLVFIDPVHVDPLGKGLAGANPVARRRHERQVQAHAEHIAGRPADAVVIAAGDWNERLLAKVPAWLTKRTAKARIHAAGARFAHEDKPNALVRIDDVAVRADPFVHIDTRNTLTPRVKGNDHHAVIARYRTDHLEAP